MRLNKFIAHSGYASRRKADTLIFEGQVKVNGEVIDNPGFRVGESDSVSIGSKVLNLEENKIYIALNKPMGYMSSLSDPNHNKFVTDLVKNIDERLYPVGRLDVDSRGLILLTNDGKITYKLTHPKFQIPKDYQVQTNGILEKEELEKMFKGIVLEDGYKAHAYVKLLEQKNKIYNVRIFEGRNRQIRKMFGAFGYKVVDLKRYAIGKINLGNLKEGKYRFLTLEEQSYLEEL